MKSKLTLYQLNLLDQIVAGAKIYRTENEKGKVLFFRRDEHEDVRLDGKTIIALERNKLVTAKATKRPPGCTFALTKEGRNQLKLCKCN